MSLIDDIRKIKSNKLELRNFGLVIGGIFLLLAAVAWWRDGRVVLLSIVGAALILPGIFYPRILLPLYKIWMALATILGWVMTRVVLLFTFFFMVTPIALLLRLIKKQPLDLSWKPSKSSYWQKRDQNIFNQEHYEQQF